MVNLENIHSFTDFQRNAKSYANQIHERKEAIVLTINGEAALVIHEASAFQDLITRLQRAETELQEMKVQLLKQEIELGLQQLEKGQGIAAEDLFARLRDRSQALRESGL